MTQAPELEQAHPLCRLVAGLLDTTDEAASCSRVGLSVAESEEVMLGLARLGDQVAALQLAVLAESGEVAEEHAFRSPGAWLAHVTRQDPGAGRAQAKLAGALRDRWTHLADAFAQGLVNHAQTKVIAAALADLPRDIDPDVLTRAEAKLVELAADHTPAELKKCGWRILELLAPDVVDERERDALARAEARARRQTKLTLRTTSAGMVRIVADVPALHGELLKTQLHALLNPRRTHLDRAGATIPERDEGDATQRDGTLEGAPRRDEATGEQVPYSHRMGHALCSMLERVDLTRLPVHGASAATLLIHLDYDKLRAALGTATLGTGESSITAGEARRLACNARLVPAVLGGDSELLDLGRAHRLFSPAQRTALEIRHRHCQAAGCDIPAPWTEAHHVAQWERDCGPTDLDNGALLCSYHHHRIHDPAYDHRWHPDQSVTFRRRG